MEKLIIVESPTKAKTLSRFLGEDFKIEASMGHVRDLPKSKIGVDIDKNFEPSYVIPRDKRKTVERLKDLAKKAKEVILATDPDREGEAIAWHIHEMAVDGKNKAKRIVFHEITKEAILEALKSPRGIDLKLVDAQVARRILDRLVGYKLSPLLWFKVKKGLSAGRVQSIALRLIVEREREIEAFKPDEYWSIEAILRSQKKEEFEASLIKIDGEKAEIKNGKRGDEIVSDLDNKDTQWIVSKAEQKEVKKSPYPPFTTSTMTQSASYNLGFSSKKTMKLAQDLYEEGLITYHRTDSFNISASAINNAREFINKNFGDKFLPAQARIYKTKSKVAQEAHEAVRPTNVGMGSEESIIKNLGKDHQKLYDLIWKRFVACQMADAAYNQVSLDISAKKYLFRASGSEVKFPGWQKVYGEKEEEVPVPLLGVGEKLNLLKLTPNQHFTEAPPRYTEASLIKALEEDGIGRPSTYAPIISTIIERLYIELLERKLVPTPLGIAVSDFLVKNFPKIINVEFTAKMEDELDQIADGKIPWVPVIREFYEPFASHLNDVSEGAERVKIAVERVDKKCPEGHNMVIRYGRFGKFLACEKYPEHKYTEPFETEEQKKKEEEVQKLGMKCPKCGSDIVVRKTRKGRIFYGCSSYPKCKWASWTIPTTN
ncbi:MAG: DNA topoisomerase I [Candidatus Woykebacteria bacterium RBG_13_40_15]|uniref:DNA topoisomerase 1 n=1 Tax=Candidatus Woykebacteria bacterium RBG_13_40_15 TaxID=1802593 RepID=A0A1G1W693_9BACT|nr:MAG: DNA topoisomerase I [Candidatus Woykebacteria bacterium RBG_13_40_15]